MYVTIGIEKTLNEGYVMMQFLRGMQKRGYLLSLVKGCCLHVLKISVMFYFNPKKNYADYQFMNWRKHGMFKSNLNCLIYDIEDFIL